MVGDRIVVKVGDMVGDKICDWVGDKVGDRVDYKTCGLGK